MGWNHVVSGWDTYEQHLWALRTLGVEYTECPKDLEELNLGYGQEKELRKQGHRPALLRKAFFVHPVTKRTIFIEEYAAYSYYDRTDRIFRIIVDAARYREGERPWFRDWTVLSSPDEKCQAA